MITNALLNLLSNVYSTNVALAVFKQLNYSDSGARALLTKPMDDFHPDKFIKKVKSKNPVLNPHSLDIWQDILEELKHGVNNPINFFKKFLSFIYNSNPEIKSLPLFTIGCMCYSDVAITSFLRSGKLKKDEQGLLSDFPHSFFSTEALSDLSKSQESKFSTEITILIIAALDLDLASISNKKEYKELSFVLTATKEYSDNGIKPVEHWISNLHNKLNLQSKEELYRVIQKSTGEEYEAAEKKHQAIRRRLKSWQSGTKPSFSKLNDLFECLTPDPTHEDFICFNLAYTIRTLIGFFPLMEEKEGATYSFESVYLNARSYLQDNQHKIQLENRT